MLKETVMRLERCREIRISEKVREKLFKISPATIDRLLAKERKKQQIKGRFLCGATTEKDFQDEEEAASEHLLLPVRTPFSAVILCCKT